MLKHSSLLVSLKLYGLVLAVFSLFRALFFIVNLETANLAQTSFSTVVQAFVMGLRFDIVIAGYILVLPVFLLFLWDIVKIKGGALLCRFCFYWVFVLFTLAFSIAAADIPYFMHFYERFSVGAFTWMDNLDFIGAMILQEPLYFLITVPFLLLEYFFYKGLKKILVYNGETSVSLPLNLLSSLLFLALMLLGVRGRIAKKSPIRIGTAYFSDNSFLNKMGLNPVFTFMRSCLDLKDPKNKVLQLMDKEVAIKQVQTALSSALFVEGSPIAREIIGQAEAVTSPNVVLIIMESMSAGKMQRHGNQNNLTPFLDSLSHEGLYFEQVYTAGKHTFNGIFSTLFSFPALYRQQPMKQVKRYNGMSQTLLEKGYSTAYFTTHDSQFDNIEGFLRGNAFQNIVSEKDYPAKEVKSALGVPDDYMFRYSIPVLNKLADEGKPFFTTFMTVSDHGPYFIPEYFTPKTSETKQQIVEYADWSLRRFMAMAAQENWYKETVFVFVADHGAHLNATYDLALNYFHSPLLFFAPGGQLPEAGSHTQIGSQIDVFPTLMGLLKMPYLNNTLGIDLLKESRPYAIVNDDNQVGIIDSNYLCIMKDFGQNLALYKHPNKDKTNYVEVMPERAKKMADYAKANMQVFQELLIGNKTYVETKK